MHASESQPQRSNPRTPLGFLRAHLARAQARARIVDGSANDLVELTRMSRTNGGGPAAVQDYFERALVAARGAAKALDRMVPLLPAN